MSACNARLHHCVWTFTLKERRMVRADLEDFVECYNPENRNTAPS
jgi:hypothetical protein